MQLVSTFAYVYCKDVSPPPESICYLGPHMWYVKESEIKQASQKKGRRERQQLRQIETQYAKDLF